MKITHKEAHTAEIAEKVANAMEDCSIEVFSISFDGKVFHIWGKSIATVNTKKLDQRISELLLGG